MSCLTIALDFVSAEEMASRACEIRFGVSGGDFSAGVQCKGWVFTRHTSGRCRRQCKLCHHCFVRRWSHCTDWSNCWRSEPQTSKKLFIVLLHHLWLPCMIALFWSWVMFLDFVVCRYNVVYNSVFFHGLIFMQCLMLMSIFQSCDNAL
jgi:hypothetical protein